MSAAWGDGGRQAENRLNVYFVTMKKDVREQVVAAWGQSFQVSKGGREGGEGRGGAGPAQAHI